MRRVTIVRDPVGNFFVYRKGWLDVSLELVTTETWLTMNLSANLSTSPPSFTIIQPFCSAVEGYYVTAEPPGGSDNPLNDSEVALQPGDLITSMDCKKLGEEGANFYSILYKFEPGDTVNITFYRASEQYATAHCAMVRLQEPPVNQMAKECIDTPLFPGEAP